MVPNWVRGQESAEIVGRLAAAARDARPRRQRRHAGRRRRGRGPRRPQLRGARRSRAIASRAASSSSTCRSRTTARRCSSAPPARRAPRRSARSRCSSARSARPACARRTPARCTTPTTCRRFRRRRSRPRTPTGCSACAIAARTVVVRLKMEAHFEPDADSANVVGEIRGRERPDEVVVVSGHLDSWDVGAGATDDGGGCVVTWEALRMMKKLNLRPRRTVRVVLWTNEENGGRGGLAYRDQHRAELAQSRDDAGVGQRRVPPARVRLHRQRRGARTTVHGDRHAAARHRTRIRSPAGGERRRHRPERRRRAASRRCRSRSTVEVLPDPPHAGRHDRQDRSGRDGPCAAAVAVMAYVVADLPDRVR